MEDVCHGGKRTAEKLEGGTRLDQIRKDRRARPGVTPALGDGSRSVVPDPFEAMRPPAAYSDRFETARRQFLIPGALLSSQPSRFDCSDDLN
jgi:hypothetical protein